MIQSESDASEEEEEAGAAIENRESDNEEAADGTDEDEDEEVPGEGAKRGYISHLQYLRYRLARRKKCKVSKAAYVKY